MKTLTVTADLNPTKRGKYTDSLYSDLAARIIGQPEAVDHLINVMQMHGTGLSAPGRPSDGSAGCLFCQLYSYPNNGRNNASTPQIAKKASHEGCDLLTFTPGMLPQSSDTTAVARQAPHR
ncbi:MAG: hypothetical protein ACR2JB_08275 [Bryobacteraceae bacterium]